MKQFFTIFLIMIFTSNTYSQVITQNTIPNTVENGNSIGCVGAGFTSETSYIRSFRLQDFGITSDFTITNVAFGVDNVNGTFPVTVKLYNVTGTFPSTAPFPDAALTLLGSTNVTVSPANNLGMVNTGTNLSVVIPAGGSFVTEINHNGEDDNPRQFFSMGNNTAGETGPSYIVAPTCGITFPLETGTGPIAGFAKSMWVMTITGQTTALGITEVINSPDLQIFPNPVKDVLKFRFNNHLKSEAIEIFDMNGRVITSVQNNKNVNEVNMSAYPKGNYILKVKADDGKLYVEKIIKE